MENLIQKINRLSKERKAVILAHNYQLPEVQDIADFVGDSLELAQQAVKTEAEVIVLCGVYFMAETAAILNPDKKVLIPDRLAGCPMANMIDGEKVRKLKRQYPGAAVVCYINSTAEVKAESDICCTSSNARRVVESLKDYRQVIFVPDKYLGHWLSLGSDKEFILASGYCPTHAKISPLFIDDLKTKHAEAATLVHPECNPLVKEKADKILSTGKMMNYIKNSSKTDFIIGTEREIVHRMKKDNPAKNFYHVGPFIVCPNMKKNNLEKIAAALEDLANEVKIDEKTRQAAKKCLERMLAVS